MVRVNHDNPSLLIREQPKVGVQLSSHSMISLDTVERESPL